MNIAKNLTLKEAIKSHTAIKNNIDNSPTVEHLVNLTITANQVFQKIRDHFCEPIFVSSMYRSNKLNDIIGGSSSSQHCKGEAIDIDQDNRNSSVTNGEIFGYILQSLDFDQLIWEFGDDENPEWVHVSYSIDNNRREVLRAFYDEEGNVKYKRYD